ncbi:MAG: S-adenosyl-l-methionine hydroxide adenosyltransferase family protein [Candidatus Kapaibacterium sp.]
MKKQHIILTSDFGLDGSYVGLMKGVIARIAPFADTLDLTHAIEPQNIRQGSFILKNAMRYFPDGSIYLTVIDPGVGSHRRSIAAKCCDSYFIAPDNGVLSYIFDDHEPEVVVELTESEYHIEPVSDTFHGRDIFAPAAAHIAAGIDIKKLGREIAPDSLERLHPPVCFIDREGILHGEIVYADSFGNLITSVSRDFLQQNQKKGKNWIFTIKGKKIFGLSKTYSDVEIGKFIAYFGSSNYLEIGVRNGNAANVIGTKSNLEFSGELV